MHASGTAHRDLRPVNLSLTKEGKIKIGVEQIQVFTGWNLKAVKDTDQFYYLAPELLMGKEPNLLSDIWALGVLLYELCYLKRPFDNGPQVIVETKIKQGGYDDSAATFTEEMKDLISRLLDVNAELRPSIEDVLRHPLLNEGY